MIFKNAFHLLVDNFLMTYKLILYKLFVAVIVLALSAALVYPTLHMLVSGAPFQDVLELLNQFVKAIASGDVEFLNGFAEALQERLVVLGSFIAAKTPNIVFFVVAVVVIVLVGKFLDGIGNFAFGSLLGDRMSSYAKTSFFSAYISNLGRASLWQVVYVPLTFVYDLVVLGLCYVVLLALLNIISVAVIAATAALMLSVALFLCAQAVKLTLFNDAVPAFVTEKAKLRTAWNKTFSFSGDRFSSLFSTYLVTCLLIWCLNILFAFATFGAALLITVPMSYLMLINIQFVSYYTYGRRKYFLAEDKIVQPRQRSDEDFYDDFEI